MAFKPNILILSAGYGEGHNQAATALAQAFKERRHPIRVSVVDYVEMVHPIINSITRFAYKNSVKYAPKLYGLFFKRTNDIHPASNLQQLVRQFGSRKLLRYIHATEPTIVINTFPLSAGTLSWLKQQRRTHVMAATVITDYTVHSQWVHDEIEYYFVGSEHVKQSLVAKGIAAENVAVTGIPIRPSFHYLYDRRHLKHTFGLDDRPTALIMGGWHGVFNASLCERLAEKQDIQLLFVCGGDRKLYNRILPLQMRFPDRVRVFGYVTNIPELMSVSDFILAKAGGLTTSEALAMGLPMLLYRPIPGQEEQNADYLINEGVACLARNTQQLFTQFERLCNDREQLNNMKKRAELFKLRGNAASVIAEQTLQHVFERYHGQHSPLEMNI